MVNYSQLENKTYYLKKLFSLTLKVCKRKHRIPLQLKKKKNKIWAIMNQTAVKANLLFSLFTLANKQQKYYSSYREIDSNRIKTTTTGVFLNVCLCAKISSFLMLIMCARKLPYILYAMLVVVAETFLLLFFFHLVFFFAWLHHH